ncbi:cupin domain-containing protein [Propionibacterium australiense]|uniref:Cupin domain n=1 Tax=Propionibacterium australiense TaxID=119981 RepID=A0A383S4J8_9ACTN|nr:cupin domain-containing protein [Propionibacterium australiense]RLP08937.1 cupin domain-containing protein [Propionibacterium australiense]RLP11800.1 cupin domain-containing protein [Propionibacterium australiense]SYZ32482.1 Cupin domain [Propionibacterium australiense]VEH90123.1 Cupin domain [Propionibacterium australiense]
MEATPVTQSVTSLGLAAKLPQLTKSTLSRVVVDNPAVRVVCFTLDEGQSIDPHREPDAEVITLLDGELELTVGERTCTVIAGDVVYLAPGERQGWIATKPSRLQQIIVSPGPVG